MSPSFFKNLGPINLKQIHDVIKCDAVNFEKNEIFNEFVGKEDVKNNSLSFIYDHQKIEKFLNNNCTLICTKKKSLEINNNQKLLIVNDVQFAVAKLSNYFYRNFYEHEVESLKDPIIGKDSFISDKAVIQKGSMVGSNVKIYEGAVIKHSCIIGDGCEIASNSVIANSILADNVAIGPNTSIGQPGFGFSILKSQNERIFHIGKVVLHNNVNIGANCTIDQGSFSDTIIGENTYFDNQCHIAHNVKVGRNCVFAGMVGIAGSAQIGNSVLAGGQVGISGHIKVGDNVKIAAKSAVYQDVNDNESVMGSPAINKYKFMKQFKKNYVQKTN